MVTPLVYGVKTYEFGAQFPEEEEVVTPALIIKEPDNIWTFLLLIEVKVAAERQSSTQTEKGAEVWVSAPPFVVT